MRENSVDNWENETQDICIFCLGDMGEKRKTLECLHSFDEECFKTYNKLECPLCRDDTPISILQFLSENEEHERPGTTSVQLGKECYYKYGVVCTLSAILLCIIIFWLQAAVKILLN